MTWNDETRVMQALVLGQTGSGKTTLLRNIITQDLMRRVGPPGGRKRIPMVIFDGKGDLEFFHSLPVYPPCGAHCRSADAESLPAGAVGSVQPVCLRR